LPDSVSFSGFSNPRFIKIRKKMDADSMRFLFELPEGMHMKLSFDSDRLETWQTGNTLSMEILFDGARWTSAITDQPYRIRSDSEGKPYVLIGPGENTELHDALKTLFPECFVADGAEFL